MNRKNAAVDNGREEMREWSEERYDIGLVQMMNNGLGNGIVNFALFRFLEDCGYRVLVVDVLKSSEERDSWKKSFACLPYAEDEFPRHAESKEELRKVNDSCAMFLLGSDQLLRACFIQDTRFHTCLNWVSPSKCKASYAVSFGAKFFEDEINRQRVKYYLRRFQKLSVREKSGVDIMKQQFGREAQWVLDPVFLCARKYYDEMCLLGENRLPRKKYIAAYLLDMVNMGKKVFWEVSRRYGEIEYIAILESELRRKEEEQDSFHTMPFAKIEEWLAMIKNSEFVVTDSFHGVCFALIFQKEFCVVFEKENWRGLARIESLLSLLGLGERMVLQEEDVSRVLACGRIDYTRVNEILDREKAISSQWLSDTIEEGLKHDSKDRKDIPVIVWGAGACFKRSYERFCKEYPLKYVCDTNPEKWGSGIFEGITCISPEQLKNMGDVFVVIAVDSPDIAIQIANMLLDMGIYHFDHIYNWLA